MRSTTGSLACGARSHTAILQPRPSEDGWPGLVHGTIADAQEFNASYCDDLTSTDVRAATGVHHDPTRMRRLRKSAKLHFCDPALACAALHLSVDRLTRDPQYFGRVFESMAIRDLMAHLDASGGRLYHYRDETGLEADGIAEFLDGGWAAFEVKLGSSAIPGAEANLIKVRDERVDTDAVGAPGFLAVITGTEYGYTLPSGVHVIPLGTLTA